MAGVRPDRNESGQKGGEAMMMTSNGALVGMTSRISLLVVFALINPLFGGDRRGLGCVHLYWQSKQVAGAGGGARDGFVHF